MTYPFTKKLFSLSLIIVCSAIVFSNAETSSELSSKLKKVAKKFSDVYKSKPKAEVPATIAVFPFQTDEKLEKQKVNFAVREIFSHDLLELNTFKIVERTELEKLLEEQKLGLSGVIETDSAVKIGKLMSAKLLVLGSINRLGSSYQISARLINTETGEVMSSEFTEVAVKVFEQEAAPYLTTLAPETQGIGIYAFYESFMPSLKATEELLTNKYSQYTYSYSYSGVTYDIDFTPKGVNGKSNPYGLGIKYFPLKWLSVDFGYMLGKPYSMDGVIAERRVYDDDTNLYADQRQVNILLDSSGYRGMLSGVLNLSKKIKIFAGGGLNLFKSKITISGKPDSLKQSYFQGDGDTVILQESFGSSSQENWSSEENLDKITYAKEFNDFGGAFGRLGIEWRPQTRFAIGIFGNLGTAKTEDVYLNINTYATSAITPGTAEVTEQYSTKLFTIEFPETSIEVTVSLYF
ncbi:MAG: CsgG/HfaB family protein [Elusimicrobiota bacterium]|nr:CsgG/HfaB family protein [Elusimicrobiota bacterium]